ncbi:flagellar hook-length control protein FliK [Cellvibrio sp.]|uniref:flagellar hook-length control protein FliK n=1 Tax=Cellvibrio sp. TaxID=1965322 RepID=UPI0039648501
MNNSSANMVFLKSAQATATPNPALKRDYREDASSSFQQSLSDVQASARAERQLAAKPPVKKTTQSNKSESAVESAKPAAKQVARATKDDQPLRHSREPKSNHSSDVQTENTNSRELKTARKVAATQSKPSESDAIPVAVEQVPQNPTDENSSSELGVLMAALPFASPAGETLDTQPEQGEGADANTTLSLAGSGDSTEGDLPVSANWLDKLATQSSVANEPSAADDTEGALTDKNTSESISPMQTVLSPDQMTQQATDVALAAGAAQTQMIKPTSGLSASPADTTELEGEPVGLLAVSSEAKSVVKAEVSASALPEVVDGESEESQSAKLPTGFDKLLQAASQTNGHAKDDVTQAPPAPVANTPSSGGVHAWLQSGNTEIPAARTFVVQTAVSVPVGQPQWSQAVGEKVLWLAAQNVSSAEINLNPEHLGPMQVKVSVNQEQTSVSFTSHHPVTREVLDQNLGRLRDMFSEQGLNLVNVDVSDKSFNRHQGDAQHQNGQGAKQDKVEDETPVAVSLIKQQRLVDHYA